MFRVSLPQIESIWSASENCAMPWQDVWYLQANLRRNSRLLQAATCPRGGDPRSSTPTQCVAAQGAKEAGVQQYGSACLCLAVSSCAGHLERALEAKAGELVAEDLRLAARALGAITG